MLCERCYKEHYIDIEVRSQITKDSIITALESWKTKLPDDYFGEMLGTVIDLVTTKIRDYSLSCINKWIQTDAAIPSRKAAHDFYMVHEFYPEYIVMIDGALYPTTLYYNDLGEWYDENGDSYNVIAWQPLPEPPTEKEN